jgi:hypothetical protein
MNGIGPVTALNMAKRARSSTDKDAAPWDEMRVIYKVKTAKGREEFEKQLRDCTNWPSGWKPTVVTARTAGGAHVYFAVYHNPQHQAGAYVRAILSLLA